MSRAEQPATQGLPICRATRAACEVAPPRAVRMPSAEAMPSMSSGEVSTRTSSTGPLLAISTAFSAVKAMRPLAGRR